MVIIILLFGFLVASGQGHSYDMQFIQQLPPGITNAFAKGDTLWVMKRRAVTIVKIGTGARNVPFENDGQYIKITLGPERKYFIQFADGDVGEIEVPFGYEPMKDKP